MLGQGRICPGLSRKWSAIILWTEPLRLNRECWTYSKIHGFLRKGRKNMRKLIPVLTLLLVMILTMGALIPTAAAAEMPEEEDRKSVV